ncbi:U3 small nucleolar ribonucleoprotein IMP3 [Gregarina niphandrodes]|uniref:U3 small nucleolar ribonucleoprotein IMP3 n=1 Tax=Gregarina niphandrodes TaxID=110365 RepID=A0A023B8Z0_GRENI|nr:U3 small nucleolar ribonucleoprotein IMP3 [Gregarina niphandrodes]EZG70626.1 U3 small nucleolar ribonucleoprotein IMP3 [Gregarina niphandrodes]|eukprot:XP_011129912.1 U3 small nucleolar ribonucleoprotein IMP3 [Gregarina niphandrodes]
MKLNYVEQKLLKKVNLFDYKDNNVNMNRVISKFGLRSSKEYRQYNKVALEIQQLVAILRTLPSESEVRQKIGKSLLDKLYRLGIINDVSSLEVVENFGVSYLCRRRITWILKKIKMAQHTQHAIDLVQHGHIKIGNDVVKDPAMLVTRQMEDLITWADGSKYKKHISEFHDTKDDFTLLNL